MSVFGSVTIKLHLRLLSAARLDITHDAPFYLNQAIRRFTFQISTLGRGPNHSSPGRKIRPLYSAAGRPAHKAQTKQARLAADSGRDGQCVGTAAHSRACGNAATSERSYE